MNIIALLAWYSEDAAWLEKCITGLAKIPVNHLICIDGAYALYPNGRARSGLAEYEAIHRACYATNIGCTIHTPATVWQGNEIEKRSKLFELAETIATPNEDWYLVVDADEFVLKTPETSVHHQLAETIFDVADATLSEPHPTGQRRDYPMPMFFRAIPGLRVQDNHFTYVTPDGRKLWGNVLTDTLEPRQPLTDLVFEHLTAFRHEDRTKPRREYYDKRDHAGVEEHECGYIHNGQRCTNKPKATIPYRWREADDGYAADWIAVCPEHQPNVTAKGIAQLQALGYQHAAMLYERKQWAQRPGPAPVPA